MLLTIMNHVLPLSGPQLFHGKVYSEGGEAVLDFPGKTVRSSSLHWYSLRVIHPQLSDCLLSPHPSFASRQQASKKWKQLCQRKGRICLMSGELVYLRLTIAFFSFQKQSLWSFRHRLLGWLFDGCHLEEIYNIKYIKTDFQKSSI